MTITSSRAAMAMTLHLSSRAAIAMTVLLVACAPSPTEVQHERAAEARAREWLAQIDAGDYGGS